MEGLTLGVGEPVVDQLPDALVGKAVGGVPLGVVLQDDAPAPQLVQTGGEQAVILVHQLQQQAAGHLLGEEGDELGHLEGRAGQAGEPVHQDIPQGLEGGLHIAAAAVGLGQLGEQIEVASGLPVELGSHAPGGLTAQLPAEQLLCLFRGERGQAMAAEQAVRLQRLQPGQGRGGEVVPGGEDGHQPPALQAAEQGVPQTQALLVSPLQVLQHQEHLFPAGDSGEEEQEAVLQPLVPLAHRPGGDSARPGVLRAEERERLA